MGEKRVSDWLSKRDAWTIYDAGEILTDLSENTVCGVIDMGMEEDDGGRYKSFIINYPNPNIHKPQTIYPYDVETVWRMMNNRGLGGEFDPEDSKWFIAGYSLANHLAMLIAGKISRKSGRGFSFQENISIIREAENG